jgi:hypothetical protein
MTDSKNEPVRKYRLKFIIRIPFAPSAKSIVKTAPSYTDEAKIRLLCGETRSDKADFDASLVGGRM